MTGSEEAGQLASGDFAALPVGHVETLTDDSVAITFSVAGDHIKTFHYRPGQHVILRRTFGSTELRRPYSICATPASSRLRIAVRRIEGGRMSTWLTTQTRTGDVIDVAAPSGQFGRQAAGADGKAIGLIGAGSGVTPLFSIAAAHLESGRGNSVVMVLGNRTSTSIMLAEDLADLKNRFTSRMHMVHVLSREQQATPDLNGRLDRARLGVILQRFVGGQSAAEWFLCGPKPMTDDARAALLGQGVAESHVHRELFFAKPRQPSASPQRHLADSTVEVTLNGRTTTLMGSRSGNSILDDLIEQRADAPFACKSGVCGTCRARCTSGEVKMAANYVLEESELAAGIVLTCQARPATRHVKLEYT